MKHRGPRRLAVGAAGFFALASGGAAIYGLASPGALRPGVRESPPELIAATGSGPTSAPDLKRLRFSGYSWWVKRSSTRVGPGPNFFSDQNVWVDSQGQLHLRLAPRQEGGWSCGEAVCEASLGLGEYRFVVAGRAEVQDPQAVLGLFSWCDSGEYFHREIDCEISRWGRPGNKSGQFCLQPYANLNSLIRFEIPPGLDLTTHSFVWSADQVSCRSTAGPPVDAPPPGSLLCEHTFRKRIPPGGAHPRVNLWLVGGRPPQGNRIVEVVLRRFDFAPLRGRSSGTSTGSSRGARLPGPSVSPGRSGPTGASPSAADKS